MLDAFYFSCCWVLLLLLLLLLNNQEMIESVNIDRLMSVEDCPVV